MIVVHVTHEAVEKVGGIGAVLSGLMTAEAYGASVSRTVLVGPLLFPLRGLLHGRSYTFAWSAFLALLYFIHGAVEAYSMESARYLGLLEVVLSVTWFSAAVMYVRVGRELEDR